MPYEDWTSTLAPKVAGTWNLHRALLNSELDFFLVFSSLSGLRGNNGQANYAAANTFLDAFVQYRSTMGLPASAVTLGPVKGIGRASHDSRLMQALSSRSIYLLTGRDVLDATKLALCQRRAESSEGCLIPGDLGIGMVPTKPGPGISVDYLLRDARFGTFTNSQTSTPVRDEENSDSVLQEISTSIMGDPTLVDNPKYRGRITREVGKQISLDMSNTDDLSDEESANLHIDSLMSLEVRYYLRRNLGIDISLIEISNAGTAGKLGEVIFKALKEKYGPEKTIEGGGGAGGGD